MKITSAYANKLLKSLTDEEILLGSQRKPHRTYVAAAVRNRLSRV